MEVAMGRFFYTMSVEDEISGLIIELLPEKIELFSLKTAVISGGAKIVITLDKPDSQFGSPSLEELELVTRRVTKKMETFPPPFDNPQLEVTSPGAERTLRLPDDLSRFVGFAMKVQFYEGEAVQVKKLRLTKISEDTTHWSSFVKNKKKIKKQKAAEETCMIQINQLKAANLILEY